MLLLQVDPELERKLCNVVAVQLEDQSGDISGLAVKWWVHLLWLRFMWAIEQESPSSSTAM
jgi:hypothetical protein